MASPTPLGIHQISSGEQYALVEDLNRVGVTADAAIAFVKDRAEYLTDKAVADAGALSRQVLDEARALSQKALNDLPGHVVAEVDRVIGDTREDAAEALTVAQQAYEYNQTLIAPAAAVVNAIVTDPATPAGALVDSKVHVGDTYVGVTQQPGATMKDKLHAALAEASASGGVVMLPDEPIDVGTGLKLAGYSCGIVGRGAIQDSVKGVETPTSSAIVASQQSGPVMDFDGFNWPAQYRGRLRFADFAVSGTRQPDPTGANHGIYIRPGQGGTGYAGGGAVVWDNLTVSNCAGNALDLTRTYFHNWTNIVLIPGVATNGVSPRVLRGQNVGGCNFDLFIYGGVVSGTDKVTRTDGLLWVGDDPDPAATYHSAYTKFDIVLERFHLAAGATVFAHQGHNNTIEMRWYDVLAVAGAEASTSYLRLEPSTVHFPSAGGNTVNGLIPGDGGGAAGTVGNGVIVSQRGNTIIGSRSYRNRNVVLKPGASDTFVMLTKSYTSVGAKDAGIIDESGETGNTLLDYSLYPADGRNPLPALKTADETRTSATPGTLDDDLAVLLEPNATYRVRAELIFTTDLYGRFRLVDVPGWQYDLRMACLDADGNLTISTSTGNPSTYATPFGSGTRQTATLEGTVRTGSVAARALLQWRAGTSSGYSTTLHEGSHLTVERIA